MALSTIWIIMLILIIIVLCSGIWWFFKQSINVSQQYRDLLIQKDKLHSVIAEETKQRSSYQKRCLELEDAIKEGVGVSLRKEVTRVTCVFDQHEMNAILEGSRYLVKEYYKSTAALKFYLKLIEKIEQNLSLMIKEKENENTLQE
jgi:hypothetical protein